jgi:subtilase family serine protease
MLKRVLVPLAVLIAALAVAVSSAGAAPAAAALAQPTESSRPGASIPTVEALIELRHRRGLDSFVRQVSDPTSPEYRQYSTVEALVARYGASAQARQETLAWLRARGLHGKVGPTGTYVTAPIPAPRVATLLPRRGAPSASPAPALGRAVPAGLRDAVSGITVLGGGNRAFTNLVAPPATTPTAKTKKAPKKKFSSLMDHTGTASGCAEGVAGPDLPEVAPSPFTPNQYLKAYGVSGLQERGLKGQGQHVALVEVDGFHRSDITTFDKCFGIKTPPIHVVPVFPYKKPIPEGGETTLDLEVLSAAAPRVAGVDVYEGAGNEAGIVVTAGTALGRRGHHPDVISISLGICEPLYSGKLIYKRALDSIFATAAGAGISVLVASGDTGSSGCRVDGPEGETTALPIRAVSLPSSSPYVTAVGGTNLKLSAANSIEREVVWNDWPLGAGGGGGGVSILSPQRPWWQKLPPSRDRYGLGRIVPDIAALADPAPGYSYFCTSVNVCGELPQTVHGWTSIGGTSAATPLMAATVALGNQYAERHGEGRLGFLNPLLYRLGANGATRAAAFRDVSRGNDDIGALLPANVGGGHSLHCCSARVGYDWASGWGSLKALGFARAASAAAPRANAG